MRPVLKIVIKNFTPKIRPIVEYIYVHFVYFVIQLFGIITKERIIQRIVTINIDFLIISNLYLLNMKIVIIA